MKTAATRTILSGGLTRSTACDSTAEQLYDAEVTLHCARQSGIDAWVAAAYERLHEAIEAHFAAAGSP